MHPNFSHRRFAAAALLAALLLAGCATVGPDYREPPAMVAGSWQAPLPHAGDAAAMAGWWAQFDDPLLARLQEAAAADSPTLASAWARIEQARATLASSRADGLPQLMVSSAATRGRQQAGPVTTTRTTTLDASWELDLFGRVRRGQEAAQARIDARLDDWHDARISLAAEVADTLVQYRSCVQLARSYEQELASMNQTLRVTESLVRAGLNASSDGALARASVASTRSASLAQREQCELLVKSLAGLTGLEEPKLRLDLAQGDGALPRPAAITVQAMPADVLRQRPDIAALERELQAASAGIGVAQADLLPSLSLQGAIGLAGLGSSLASWSLGPILSLPLFDGGRGRAGVGSAHATFEAAYASWRQSVRAAVTEVEQALVRLDSAGARATEAERSATEYRRYLTTVEAQWRSGTTDLLALEEARRRALSAQVEMLALQRDRVRYWIALYRALGGGWQAGTDATPPRSRAAS